MNPTANYDALLLVSFGGPEQPSDVMPFLENVTRGRNIPRERLLGVAEHYYHFGGKSPLNDQNRALIAALQKELDAHGLPLPIYWGNRNWHPFLKDALAQMKADGIQRALGFFTSPFSSYSSCRQYRENIRAAQHEVGEGAPEVHKLRTYYNHPHYVEPCAELLRQALSRFEGDDKVFVLFTAHSIPVSMAQTSSYEAQLLETARLVAEKAGTAHWKLIYQSRSGAPGQPWLEPDILEYLQKIYDLGRRKVVLSPIGFISDQMEVLFDLDIEAKDLAIALGLTLVRAGTVGTHPLFVQMIRELIEERLHGTKRLALGKLGPGHDACEDACCPAPVRPPVPARSI